MASIQVAGKKIVLYKVPNLLLDEFIPFVEVDASKLASASGSLSVDPKETALWKGLDESLRKIHAHVLATGSRKLRIPFQARKGCTVSLDKDGILELRLSLSDPEIAVRGPVSFPAQYGSTFEVELEIKKLADCEFHLDFLARDDDGDALNRGELENIHCGRMTIRFDYSVVTDWDPVAPVIPKDKFIEWGHPGVKENCFHYALAQLQKVGKGVKSTRWNKKWDGTKELNEHIFQLYLEHDVAGMVKGVQKDSFENAVEYAKAALQAGVPVMAGVDDDSTVVNADRTTEHFVVLVGMGEDSTGKYFLFYDNAVSNSDIGTSILNRLYCKPTEFLIEGTGDPGNSYIANTSKGKYIVTQIRETQ